MSTKASDFNIKIFDGVLPTSCLESLRHQSKSPFNPINVGNKTFVHALAPKASINNLLNNFIRRETGIRFKEIAAFLRLNTPTKNTEFRIHGDGEPLADGQRCTLAAVYYLEEDDSGTAFFEHPKYGKINKPGDPLIHVNDDGLWKEYFRCQSKANRLVVYNSDLYHGRQPWAVTKDRVVLVKFMRDYGEIDGS